jgi:carbon-monoxide dehydrogenase large subunit
MHIGKVIKRREDFRLTTGRGRFVDDVAGRDVAHLVFVRSPHGHARLRRISCERAMQAPGVLRIVTAADWEACKFGRLEGIPSIPFSDGRPMNEAPRPAFASGKVRHIGEIVAAVVARSLPEALNAAEAVDVEYEVLEAITDTRAAVTSATLVHENFGTNLLTEIVRGDRRAVDEAFARAAHVSSLTLPINRVAGMPIETQCYVADYNAATDQTTLWATTQMPHRLRQWLCHYTLKLPQHKLRVIAPDVGGGFGVKGNFIPEASTVVWLARELQRLVKWSSTRSEAFLTDTQGRDHHTTARMAFERNGVILASEVDTIAAIGAYASSSGPGIPGNSYLHAITGLYRTPLLHLRVRCVYTNTLPVAAYRGSGRPEAAYINERLLESGAREMGIDVVEMRRRNLIQADEFPFRTPAGRVYDCGNPPVMLNKLTSLSRYDELRREQASRRKNGEYLGIGLAAFLDKSGTGPTRGAGKGKSIAGGYESATVRVHSDGKVTLLVGSHSHGQSHETTFSAVAADRLEIPMEDIDVVEGDTGRIQFGNGTWGSRSISVGGAAICTACDQTVAKMRRIASHILEVGEVDVSREDGFFIARNSNRKLSFAEISEIAYGASKLPKREGFEPGLEFTAFHDPVDLNDPLSMHLATVVIDKHTGELCVRDYFTIDDCGNIINPMVVEGQIHGGLAQGIGQAVMEGVVYDPHGQLLTGSFMDYAMPRASDMPDMQLDFHVTAAPSNPLGVKGGSETGVIGPPAAIANAVIDALWHLGVRDVRLPLTSESIWRLIRQQTVNLR